MPFKLKNYSIKRGLPTWFADNAFFDPINDYTAKFIPDSIKALLGKLGLIQPWQVWKNIPHFYTWTRAFTPYDEGLSLITDGTTPSTAIERKTTFGKSGSGNKKLKVSLPLTQRPAHARFIIKLKPSIHTVEKIDYIEIKNAGQKIRINDLNNYDEILYETKDNVIRINDESEDDHLEGSISMIYPVPKNNNFNGLDLENRNAENFVTITSSGESVNFELTIELIQPTYVVDQNVRLWTVSALPLAKCELYGYFCHEFNNNHGWRLLETKKYSIEDRVVYDRFTTQYDCEIFFIKTYYHGLDEPIVVGFPQEENAPNPIFETNKNLDYWGQVYSMPRQKYKEDISDEEEPFTKAAKYYKYAIEQDYWYEQRIANEYKNNEFAVDGVWIKDTKYDNLAMVTIIDPYIDNLYMYTESKPKVTGNTTIDLLPSKITESGIFTSWLDVKNLKSADGNKRTYVVMEPATKFNLETKTNKSNLLSIDFDLNDIPDYTEFVDFGLTLDMNSSISGFNIELEGSINVPYLDNNDNIYWQSLPLNYKPWLATIRDKHEILSNDFEKTNTPINLALIKEYGITLNLAFTNLHEKVDGEITLHALKLHITYKTSKKEVALSTSLTKKIIKKDEDSTELQISVKNIGKVPIINEKIFIFSSNLELSKTEILINLDLNEVFEETITINVDKSGYYDIYVFALNKKSMEQLIVLR